MITDTIIMGALLYFFVNGWHKGILKTLLGPIALIIGCLIAFIYYQKTQNIAMSLSICILSPFGLRIVIALILKIWRKIENKDIPLSLLSRLFGSIFSVLWSGSYLVMFLILIGLIPVQFGWFEKIQKDVVSSQSYSVLQEFIDSKAPATSEDIKKLTTIFENPDRLQQFQSTEEFEALIEDDNLKAIFSDKEIIEQITNKEYGKLLANPKIQSVFQNEQLLKKMFALNMRIMEEDLLEEAADLTEIQPKVIDIK